MIKAKEEEKKQTTVSHLRRDEGSSGCTVTTPVSLNDTFAIAPLNREGGEGEGGGSCEFSADTIAVDGVDEVSSDSH